MSANKLLLGSLVLNAALAAALLWPKQKQEAPPEIAAPQSESDTVIRPGETKVMLPAPGRAFHWNQIETSDFQQYMANLRGIGCPEETIRDLVIAEVNKLYAPKFAALMAQAHHYDYWKPASKKSRDALAAQLEALRIEKRELLKTLLGIDSDPGEQWANLTVDSLLEQGRFAFLSAEKQKLVREILARYEAGDQIDPRVMREKRRQELAQILAPEELYQFDLRDSNAAESVRSRFGQADLSEAEYKKLFDLRKAYEDQVGAVADFSDPEKARARSEARKLLDQAYRDALGEERMKEITRQQDPGWRSLTQVGQQFNIDQQTLDRAHSFQQIAGDQMSKLLSDPNLPREERRTAMELINVELQRNMAAVLGDAAYQEFRRTAPQMTFTTGGDAFVLPTIPSGPITAPGATMIIQPNRTRVIR